MKKSLVIFLAVVLVSALILGGCPGPDAATAPAPSEVIELSFSLELPPMSWGVKDEWAPWAKTVEERCEGRVKITLFPGATLNPAMEMYDAAVKGIADISWGPHINMPGRFPMMEVFTLPGIAAGMQSGQYILWDLFHQYSQIEAEHKDAKIIYLGALSEYVILTKDKPVRTLEDLKGLRIRATGESTPTWQAWEAAPISVPSVETYEALEKGVMDGTAFDLNVVEAYRLQEVTKYMTIAPCTGGSIFLVMNLAKWNSLPADIQKIFLEEGERHWLEFGVKQDEFKMGVINRFGALPEHEVIKLSDAERARWADKAKPVYDKWAADMEAKGLPGKAYLEDTLKLSKKYNAQYPLFK
jgi:TRAP-type C4-dicarboxylate transport system substrate-binding protein